MFLFSKRLAEFSLAELRLAYTIARADVVNMDSNAKLALLDALFQVLNTGVNFILTFFQFFFSIFFYIYINE